MKSRTKHTILSILGAFALVWLPSYADAAPFFQNFETDTAGWNLFPASPQRNATRVASGTHGVTDKTGSLYHAEAGKYDLDNDGGSALTRWGGYSSVFPAGGYLTSLDIYLNVAGGFANDTRFDFISAINKPDGSHRRDFDFNAGFYNDTDATGTGPRFVISASNNAGRGGAYPKNPGRDPFPITASGWYTFQHEFHADIATNALMVVLSIRDSSGAILHTWTLNNSDHPTDPDFVGSNVGGNRYGWFASVELPFLAFDNTYKSDISLRNQKVDVRDDMVDLLETISNNDDRKKLQEAIDHLNKSLDSRNWGDDLHPKPGSYGEKVFSEEKPTVSRLRDLRMSNHSGIPAAQFQSYIDRLVQVDRDLAITAINEANARRGKADKIKTANTELTKGDADAANDHPDSAIEHYKNSWKNAVAA